MNPSCIHPEDFGAVDGLPADDPIRVHLSECPRCQARWKAYRSFLEDASSPARSRAEADAEAALGAVVRAEFGIPDVKDTVGRRLQFAIRRGWLSFHPRVRLLILTPSAALVAVAILMLATSHRPGPVVPAYRGSESGTELRLESPQVLPDGGVRLAWSAKAGADAYRVRVFDTAFNLVFETTVPTETSANVSLSALRAASRPDSGFVWRVTALREGEEIGGSGTGALRIP